MIRLSIIVPIIITIVLATLIFSHGFDLNTIYKYLRVTGRLMLVTFLISFGSSTAYYFLPNRLNYWILKYRKYIGISFAVFIVNHFIGLFLKFLYDPPFFINDTTIPEFIFGIVALVSAGTMALTSSDKAMNKIGHKKWKQLHTVCGNYILFAFWITYFDHDFVELPVFILINSLIIFRSVRRIQVIKKTKNITLIKVIPIVIIICISAFFAAERFQEKNVISEYAGFEFKARDYFPLYEGNSWTYWMVDSNQDRFVQKYEIKGLENVGGKETFKLYFSEDGYKNYAYDETGLRKYKEFDEGRIEIYDPPCSILPDMIFTRKKKVQSNYTEPFDNSKKNIEIKGEILFKISGVEDVVVKAGKFKDCIRVDYIDKWVEPDGSYDITTGVGWYAKNVGVVKERAQLIKYDPQNDKFSRYEENAELIHAVIKQW